MSVFGRAGKVSITPGNAPTKIEGLAEFLREAQQFDPRFNKEMRKASGEVAKVLLDAAKVEAGSITRNRQAVEVMKGMRVASDRIPTIKLSGSSGFVSKSRPNRYRAKKVTRGDVFFGAEFGGGARPSTRQFLRHRGTAGYFFWPTVRKNKARIADEFNSAIGRVLKTLAGTAK